MKSLYELLNGNKIAGKRYSYDFTGDGDLDGWTFFDTDTGGTSAMNDSVDGGYRITSSTISSQRCGLTWNGIKQFDALSSGMIQVTKVNSLTLTAVAMRMMNATDFDFSGLTDQYACFMQKAFHDNQIQILVLLLTQTGILIKLNQLQ